MPPIGNSPENYPDNSQQLTPEELQEWQEKIAVANSNNIFCHCRQCGYEWVGNDRDRCCQCSSEDVERIACWQFPDG
jgi:putative hemolysin